MEIMRQICKTFKSNGDNRPSTLVMPSKVPIWSKEITLEIYLKHIDLWVTNISEIEKDTKYQYLVESLKINKDMKGLGKYVGEHILPILDKV